MSKIKPRLTYANVMATVALFVALGGGAYAAATLPKNSVGASQLRKGSVGSSELKPNAVTSSKVKNGSLLSKDFRKGQLPRGATGRVGPRGLQGLQGLQGLKGLKGDTGPVGPGAMSFDGQFANDQVNHILTTVNGLNVIVVCGLAAGAVVEITDSGAGLYGWGTREQGGTGAITPATVVPSSGTDPAMLVANGPASGNLDVVASGGTGKWARFDFSVIRGTKCNFHGLIIPPS